MLLCFYMQLAAPPLGFNHTIIHYDTWFFRVVQILIQLILIGFRSDLNSKSIIIQHFIVYYSDYASFRSLVTLLVIVEVGGGGLSRPTPHLILVNIKIISLLANLKVVVPYSKIIIDMPWTYKTLHCKGEPYQFSVRKIKDLETSCYFYILIPKFQFFVHG